VTNASRPWAVLKFGGTSVASARHWRSITGILEDRLSNNERPVVVCSAVAGVSNSLEDLLDAVARGQATPPSLEELRERHLELGRDLGLDIETLVDASLEDLARLVREAHRCEEIHPALRAEVLATGELLSTRIAVRWLESQGFRVAWIDARDLLRANTPLPGATPLQHYCEATCSFAGNGNSPAARRLGEVKADVVITQGFIARDGAGDTVLLGRGGSDTAAAYLAAMLGACRLEIWTDVAGIFTFNPRAVTRARVLPRLSYDEAESLAGLGASVLHPRTIHPVREAGVPLCIRWTEQPDASGTVVTSEPTGAGAKAVVSRDHLCLITLHKPAGWKPVGFLADVSACFKRHALPVDLLSCSPSRIRTTLDLSSAGAEERLPALLEDLDSVAGPVVDRDVASVSMVGHGIQASIHRLAPVLADLRRQQILMLAHCARDLSMTLVIPSRDEKSVVRKLHRQLFERDPVSELRERTTAGV